MVAPVSDVTKQKAVAALRGLADRIESDDLAVVDFGAVHRMPPPMAIPYPTELSVDLGVYVLSENGGKYLMEISRRV